MKGSISIELLIVCRELLSGILHISAGLTGGRHWAALVTGPAIAHSVHLRPAALQGLFAHGVQVGQSYTGSLDVLCTLVKVKVGARSF